MYLHVLKNKHLIDLNPSYQLFVPTLYRFGIYVLSISFEQFTTVINYSCMVLNSDCRCLIWYSRQSICLNHYECYSSYRIVLLCLAFRKSAATQSAYNTLSIPIIDIEGQRRIFLARTITLS